jgi:hypothetical protein
MRRSDLTAMNDDAVYLPETKTRHTGRVLFIACHRKAE